MMKTFTITAFLGIFLFVGAFAQQKVHPSKVSQPVFHDRIESLQNLPEVFNKPLADFVRNAKMKERSYPFYKKMKGNDPVWQKTFGTRATGTILQNFAGQDSPYGVSDCNGAIGPNHFFQAINTSYAIYDKTNGTQLTGPTNFNTLFQGVPGAGVNDGDPIILYDEQANCWLAAEFSGVSTNPDYMLIAISATSDPTGAWNRWSFLMTGFPDYMKFGVWRDGYYMGCNSSGAGNSDVYVFERDVMIAGGAAPQMVEFDNPNRPGTFDGFSLVIPFDNDGTFAPAGTPGQFMGLSDDAFTGGGDELWIYECAVDWATPANSTFVRTQQLPVSAFDTNFGTGWDNIVQPGTTQKVDGIPGVLMYRIQYRNWGSSQSVVCTHTVDVDATDHAGLRWYELQNTGTTWAVRQEGTYAPDALNRWLGSIAMNAQHEIGLGFSVSSSTEYPGIRVVGQSAGENAAASGILDVAEMNILTGTQSATGSNRWGDYSLMSVDPVDDHTFWFTTEYYKNGKTTEVVSFILSEPSEPTLSATAVSTSQINVTYSLNNVNEPALIAWSADGVFGTPIDGQIYTPGDPIVGGGTVIAYASANGSYNHTSLTANTTYYYKAWSNQAGNLYTAGTQTNATTLKNAPVAHVMNFAAGTPVGITIPLTWTDALGAVLPDGYIIKMSNVSYAAITDPIDGTDAPTDANYTDGTGLKKVTYGSQATSFSGLTAMTTYYFKIYPYSNSGANILYYAAPTVPQTQETTSISFCTSEYSNTTDDWISNVTLNTINNTTVQDGNVSYGNYTNISTNLEAGATYSMSVTFESSFYTEHVTAWFDWNNNGLFTDPGEEYVIGSGSSTTVTGNIAVPATAFIGSIRMRVIEQWDTAPVPCGAPQSTSYGETEDYTINVTAPCTPPATQVVNLAVSAFTHNTIDLSWASGTENVLVIAKEATAVSDAPVSGTVYVANAAYGTAGTALGTGFVVFNGVGQAVSVTGLTPSTTYHFSAYTYASSTDCYNNVAPATLQQMTDIPNGLNVLLQNEIRIFPNPSYGKFSIESKKSASIEIYDLSGKFVFSTKTEGNLTNIDLSMQAKGIYLVKINTTDKIVNTKLILQ